GLTDAVTLEAGTNVTITPAGNKLRIAADGVNTSGGTKNGPAVGLSDAAGSVGIGTSGPTFKLHVVDPANTGLRVQTNAGGGTVASFGGNGDFQIDAVNGAGG